MSPNTKEDQAFSSGAGRKKNTRTKKATFLTRKRRECQV